MSDYTKTTDFTAKDSLPAGNAAKKILGSLFDTEFDAIVTAIATKFDSSTIVAGVEAGTDSNTFTDADHTKLGAIEASATADQTNAEIATAVAACP